MKDIQISAASSNDPIAPYQARPFAGNVYRSEVQPVLDADDIDEHGRHAAAKAILAQYEHLLEERRATHMGYPYNLDFDFEGIQGLNTYCINNLGDPFIESNYGVHSRPFEVIHDPSVFIFDDCFQVGVLEWFAELWEIEVKDFWGYITNCGTEGNLHGILVGRENFSNGILYASVASHYSVFKAAKMYRMQCEKIPTLATGEIDCDALKAAFIKNHHVPAIINVNIGTTVKGAVDDLDRILEVLKEAQYTEDRFYIHCDGALFGLMIPFLRRGRQPMVTFKKPIGSVSVSGHKFIGAPVPCGVVITRLSLIHALSNDIEYLNSRDATIMGSRNGHAAIYMWYALSTKGYTGLRKDVEKCMRNAHLLKSLLEKARIPVMLNELSNTVVFERPRDPSFIRKWQLACEGNVAHVVVMPNIGVDKLEAFVMELMESVASSVKHDIRLMLNEAKEKMNE